MWEVYVSHSTYCYFISLIATKEQHLFVWLYLIPLISSRIVIRNAESKDLSRIAEILVFTLNDAPVLEYHSGSSILWQKASYHSNEWHKALYKSYLFWLISISSFWIINFTPLRIFVFAFFLLFTTGVRRMIFYSMSF